MNKYYLQSEDDDGEIREVGPLTVNQIREYFLSGQIAASSQVRKDSSKTWQTLRKVFPLWQEFVDTTH